MHGDRIIATLHTDKDREIAEPETPVEPFLSRFVGRVQRKDDRLSIVPDHPLLRDAIQCRPVRELTHDFQSGDWAVAEMRRHPLKGDRGFNADLTAFITDGEDHFVPWWVTRRAIIWSVKRQSWLNQRCMMPTCNKGRFDCA